MMINQNGLKYNSNTENIMPVFVLFHSSKSQNYSGDENPSSYV